VGYIIRGVGLGPIEERRQELADAAYIAFKMADNGVQNVHIFDEAGQEMDIVFSPHPPGWVKRHGR